MTPLATPRHALFAGSVRSGLEWMGVRQSCRWRVWAEYLNGRAYWFAEVIKPGGRKVQRESFRFRWSGESVAEAVCASMRWEP